MEEHPLIDRLWRVSHPCSEVFGPGSLRFSGDPVKKILLGVIAFVALSGCGLRAQDVVGDWQGTLQAPNRSLRTIVKVTKTDKGLSAKMYSIDQTSQAINASSVSVDGTTFKYSVEQINGSYTGKISADGSSIVGTWTQGPNPLPLTLVRATKETAWEIPVPPPPPKPMAADANPTFEVATIKPSDPDAQGRGFIVNGRKFSTLNTSLSMMMQWAYGVQAKQIVGGPAWMDEDKFDVSAVPDGEGQPSGPQWKMMLQKLLVERYKLTFHHDKRDLSVYALTVAKTGSKLTKSESNGPLPSLFFGPATGGIQLPGRNATMVEFANVMQSSVLDRPVVDQTGIEGRYDFVLKWAPDDSQFGGHPPGATQTDSPLPNLSTAIQEQLGLKLDVVKAPVDVMVIDHVEKPSGN
jgi:bla regulator protein blaR1